MTEQEIKEVQAVALEEFAVHLNNYYESENDTACHLRSTGLLGADQCDTRADAFRKAAGDAVDLANILRRSL